MSDAPVDPAEVPVFTGNLALLDTKMKALSSGGTKVATAAGDIHSSFGGLRAFYKAPEAEQLFATTKPVVDLGRDLSSDMGVIVGALGAYSNDARPLKDKLDELKREAVAFRAKIADDDKWREDGDLIEENLNRRNKIAEVWTAFQAIETTCHSKIIALVPGGKPLTLNDGSNKEGMYGYDAEALKQSKSLPWGDAVAESVPWWQVWEHAYDFGKGVVVDGVWGTIKGLGTLVGFSGWDAAGQAWTGLAKLATGLVLTGIPVVGAIYLGLPDDKLPSWLRDSRTAMKETGKALVAWDQWGENPARAAGAVTFNVVTTVFTGGAAGAASGAGKAGAVAKAISFAGKAGRAIDPMTYMFKGAAAGFSKIGDVMAGLKGLGHIELPKFPKDTIALPEGSLKLPDGTVRVPAGTALPEGALRLPNGTVRLPHGTTALPPGTVRLPVEGTPKYMDPKGNIYDADGAVTQRAKDAPTGRPTSGTPAVHADPSRVQPPIKTRELAAVGARNTDDPIRLGSDAGDAGRIASDPPGGRPEGNAGDRTPGGNAGNNTPSNSLDNVTTGGRPGNADNLPARNSGDNTPAGRDTHGSNSSGGRDLPGGSTADNGFPRHDGPGGGGGLDDLGRTGDDANPPGSRADDSARDGNNAGERELTPAERKQIQDEHVRKANDPDQTWFKKYYDERGHRRSKSTIESGAPLPVLAKDANNNWISKYDMPHGPSETRYKPKDFGPDTVPDGNLKPLNAAAADRTASIDLINAEKAFDAMPSSTTQQALESAQEAYARQLPNVPNNSKISEALGEKAAALHVVRNEFPKAEVIELPKTPNGANMFDQVYKTGPNGERLVVEAKAPSGELDWRHGRADPSDPARPHEGDNGGAQGMRVKQGTRPYIRTILAEMTRRGGRDAEIAADLRNALTEGKLQYILVKANKPNGSDYAGAVMEHLKV